MLLRLLSLFAVSTMLSAQQVVLPERTYFTQGSSTALTWRSTAFRFQMIYDTAHFLDQGVVGAISITRVRFRAANGVMNGGGAAYGTVNIQMSSCPLNYGSASTTFANNRGADNQLCYSGSVTTLPTTGATPNDYFIDVTLTNPFVYNVTSGLDLVVEVDATAPIGLVPNAAASTLQCRRISAASTTAATGASATAAGIALLDFTGSGGYRNWTAASATSRGDGCYRVSTSFYEDFTNLAAFDLSNTTLTLTPNGAGGYTVVSSGVVPFYPHGPTHLGMQDDDCIAGPLPPSFGAGFPFPTGATTSMVSVCSNGYVFLGNDINADFPDPLWMLTWPTPRHAPFWVDLLPDATNNVYYDVDTNGSAVYFTYDAIPTFLAGGVCNLQIALFTSGVVQYRYGTCSGLATDNGVVGWSPGNLASDPGAIDISATQSFATAGPDRNPLLLSSTLPYVNTTATHTVSFIPANASFTVRFLSAGSQPGLDLGFIGAAGCALWVDPATLFDTAASVTLPEASFPLPIPNNASLLGAQVYGQGASFSPSANPFGVLTTNQVVWRIGNS